MPPLPKWLRAGVAVLAATTVAGVLEPARARAELLEIRQVAGGMECPECARGLLLLVKEIAGVEGGETSWNRRILTVRLRSANRATLAQVRAVVKRQHFDVREAEIVVAGHWTVDDAAQVWLAVPEPSLRYRIDLTGRDQAWRRTLAQFRGIDVIVTGRVPASSTGEDPLVLLPITVRAASSQR